MNQSDPQSNNGGYGVKLLFGLVAMFGGTWLSLTHTIKITDDLAKQGLQIDLGMTIATIGVFLILFPLLD